MRTRPLSISWLVVGVAGVTAACSSSAPAAKPATTTSGPTSTVAPGLTTTTTAAQLEACAVSNLSVSARAGSGEGGHESVVVVFTNTGTQTCRVLGYPSAWFVNQAGQRISATSVDEAGPTPSMVVLRPHAQAATTVWTANPAVPSPADCQQVTASGVKLVPPGQTAALVARIALPICTGPATNAVSVTRVISGSTQSPL